MLVLGSKLSLSTQTAILKAFVYRLTIENGYPRKNPCKARIPTISDAQWLAEHAFYVVKGGSRLMRNRHYAEPHFLAI